MLPPPPPALPNAPLPAPGSSSPVGNFGVGHLGGGRPPTPAFYTPADRRSSVASRGSREKSYPPPANSQFANEYLTESLPFTSRRPSPFLSPSATSATLPASSLAAPRPLPAADSNTVDATSSTVVAQLETVAGGEGEKVAKGEDEDEESASPKLPASVQHESEERESPPPPVQPGSGGKGGKRTEVLRRKSSEVNQLAGEDEDERSPVTLEAGWQKSQSLFLSSPLPKTALTD